MMVRPGVVLRRALPLLAAAVGLALVAVPMGAAWAERISTENVKYYLVQTSNGVGGDAEKLVEIAQRLLGSAGRSREIFDLNYGRPQPDGGRLTDPDVLHPGWALVLPWDAIGPGIIIGPLPVGPGSHQAPTPPPGHTLQPIPTAVPGAGAGSADLSSCAPTPAHAAGNIPWPQLRLAPDHAWSRSRGHGVTVAVVDLAIDGSVPALAGRVINTVTVGAGKSGSGSVCRDHGTAMAVLIAGQPTPGIGVVGIAPQATILPVTVDLVGRTLDRTQVAKGIAAGVRAGAAVVMVAAAVDLRDRQISAAVDNAVAHNVVVVVGAHPSGGPAAARPGLLRVGAAAADDTLAVPYPTGAVDVIAPGAAITAVGGGGRGEIEGSGTDFAVPFVAGLLALVRSASPDLTASAATQHVQLTADRSVTASPEDSPYGWGMIDLSAAVTDLPGESVTSGDAVPHAVTDRRVLITGGLAALLIVWVAVVRLRRTELPPAA